MVGIENEVGLKSKISSIIERLFPPREYMLRRPNGRISYFRASRNIQITSVVFGLALLLWASLATVSFVFHEDVIAAKEKSILKAEMAYAQLLSDVTAYQSRFTSVTQKLEENHALMLRLIEQNASLQQNLQTVENRLETTVEERESVALARAELKSKLNSVKTEMQDLAGQNLALQSDLSRTENHLGQVVHERNVAVVSGEDLKGRLAKLENLVVEIEDREQGTLRRLTNHTDMRIETVEKVLAKTGVDLNGWLAANRDSTAQGGPFFAVNLTDRPDDKIKTALETLDAKIERWSGLQTLMYRLPLLSPLNYFHVSGSYGKRRDPVNRKWAMHYGLDMVTTKKAPIYTASPGKVTYAGWKGKYGKLVEIDHGGGVKSRYGHLSSIKVKKGQIINYRDKIGNVGSTGRSTGAHLHYEIHVNGKPMNPLKFIKAGKHVFQEK